MTSQIKAVPYPVMVPAGDEYDFDRTETRWRLVDESTGRIVDDAQGHGYKTAQAAHSAHGYKRTMRARKTSAKNVKQRARAWWDRHNELHDTIIDMQFQALKQGIPDDDMNHEVEQYLTDHATGLHGLTVRDLLQYC